MNMQQDDLEVPDGQLAHRLWRELMRAPRDKHHDWRTPILATQGLGSSGPQARTVVLRHADVHLWSLGVYTDGRSPKCLELVAQPKAQLTFWSKRLNWQLRVSVQARVEFTGEGVNAAWDRVKQSSARADYLSSLPPGHIQPDHEPSAADSEEPLIKHHLAVLTFNVTSMDWLALSQNGHRRAKLRPDGSVMWLVP